MIYSGGGDDIQHVAPGDASDKVREGRVLDQVVKLEAVCCGHELNSALCDCPGSQSFCLCANLVDHDDLWHVILHRLNHHLVLVIG